MLVSELQTVRSLDATLALKRTKPNFLMSTHNSSDDRFLFSILFPPRSLISRGIDWMVLNFPLQWFLCLHYKNYTLQCN